MNARIFWWMLYVLLFQIAPTTFCAERADIYVGLQIQLKKAAFAQSMDALISSEELLHLQAGRFLEEIRNDVSTHKTNSLDLAQRSAQKLLNAALQEHLMQETKKHDPSGDLALLQILEEELNRAINGGESLRGLAARRIKADLANGEESLLLRAYGSARAAVATEQLDRVFNDSPRFLQKLPNEREIIAVVSGARSKESLLSQLSAVVLGPLQSQLLAEADLGLQTALLASVDDGLYQYQQQKKILEDTDPRSYTFEGIKRELIASLERSLPQIPRIQGSKKLYGAFVRNDQNLGENIARSKFQKRLGPVIRNIEVAFSEEFKQNARTTILAAPGQHYRFTNTLGHFDGAWETSLRTRLIDRYRKQGLAEGSEDDLPEFWEGLERQLPAALTPTSLCRVDWNQALVRARSNLEGVLQKLRSEIAQAQAKERCPGLFDGTWLPMPEKLPSNPLSEFSEAHLAKLEIWSRPPPITTALLEETWSLLVNTARTRIQACYDALAGQRTCIDSLREEITKKIRESPEFGSLHWRQYYTQQVLRLWQAKPGAAQYQELFQVIQEQIRGVVDAAVASEALEAQLRIAEEQGRLIAKEVNGHSTARQYGSFDSYYSKYRNWVSEKWQQHTLAAEHPTILQPVDLQMRGTVQKLINAQYAEIKQALDKALSQAAAEIQKPSEIRDFEKRVLPPNPDPSDRAKVQIVKSELIEQLQNKIVDEVKLRTKAEIEEQTIAGKDPQYQTVLTSFNQQVRERWKVEASELPSEDQTIRPRVEERIKGIVTDLLKEVPDLRAKVGQYQSDLVSRHREEMRQRVQNDYVLGRPVSNLELEYRGRYERLVKQDWDKSDLARNPGYRNLLKRTTDEIAGIIDDLIKESLSTKPPTDSVSRNRQISSSSAANAAGSASAETIGKDTAKSGASLASGAGAGAGRGAGGTGVGAGGQGQGGLGGLSDGGDGQTDGGGKKYGELSVDKPENNGYINVLWLLLLLLIIALLFWRWRHLKNKQQYVAFGNSSALSSWYDPEEIRCLWEQLRLASEHLESREIHPPLSLEEAHRLGQEIIKEIESKWAQQTSAREIRQLLPLTHYVVFGSILQKLDLTQPFGAAHESIGS